MEEKEEEKKEIEIVSGDGSNLDISPVYDHLNVSKPNTQKPKNIILPKPMSNKSKKTKDDSSNQRRL